MKRWDFVGGIFLRVGRRWLGLVASWPLFVVLPVIAGGVDVTDTFYAGDAFIGYGAQFMVGQGDGSPETFVAVPDIEKITPGDMTTGVVQITHLRSPGRHHEKKGTIRDSGAIVLMGNYRPDHGAHKQSGGDGFDDNHSLLNLWRNVVENNFKIVLPEDANNIEIPLRGVVTKYQIGEIGLDGKVPFTAEITPLRDYSGDLP